MNGTVKWFDAQKGFGFITGEAKDYFVHYKDILADGFKKLTEGEKVTFDINKTSKGFNAINVVREVKKND